MPRTLAPTTRPLQSSDDIFEAHLLESGVSTKVYQGLLSVYNILFIALKMPVKHVWFKGPFSPI